MIHNPQIFVIYEGGMFGTFICSLFMKQKLWTGAKSNTTFPGGKQYINAHRSGYKDILTNFHTHHDSNNLLKKTKNQLIDFFSPLHKNKLGVHRLASYNFMKIDFKQYFSHFVIVLLKPHQDRLDVYGERMFRSMPTDYHTQWWAKNVRKKGWHRLPKFFLEEMSIKEKQKYIRRHTDLLDKSVSINQKNTIVFDPDNIAEATLLQKMTENVCNLLGIEIFKLPFAGIKGFINKNKKYLK